MYTICILLHLERLLPRGPYPAKLCINSRGCSYKGVVRIALFMSLHEMKDVDVLKNISLYSFRIIES